MGASATLGSPAWMQALKDHCEDHIDRLWADAGITDGMTSDERDERINAEYARRRRAAAKREAEAAFWRAVQRRNEGT